MRFLYQVWVCLCLFVVLIIVGFFWIHHCIVVEENGTIVAVDIVENNCMQCVLAQCFVLDLMEIMKGVLYVFYLMIDKWY
jgi:hypothetical protein